MAAQEGLALSCSLAELEEHPLILKSPTILLDLTCLLELIPCTDKAVARDGLERNEEDASEGSKRHERSR